MSVLRPGILQVISDGKFHKLHELIQTSAGLISEEQAQRAYKSSRRKGERTTMQASLEDQSLRGRKRIIYQHLKRLEKGGAVEITGTGYDIECRLRFHGDRLEQAEPSILPPVTSNIGEVLAYLNEAATLYRQLAGVSSNDKDDFERHFRDICRVVKTQEK